jgi:hypothetical protein
VTDSSFDDLIEQCERSAAANEEFVGSPTHLDRLKRYADSQVPGVTLTWGPYSCSELTEDGIPDQRPRLQAATPVARERGGVGLPPHRDGASHCRHAAPRLSA